MPFITLKQSPKYHQVTFEEILNGEVNVERFNQSPFTTNTRTYYTHRIPEKFIERFDIQEMINVLRGFNISTENLRKADRQELYNSFCIPKRTGGLRHIDAPKPELMAALTTLKIIFENNLMALYHTTAFAYIKKRSTIDCIRRHQHNNSWWYLKTDFSNFFGSSTPEFIMSMLSEIFPFCEIIKDKSGKDELSKALSLCFLNGGLPQGTPISPMLTNIMMIPIDHVINRKLSQIKDQSFVYTRYADDILVSSRRNFDQNIVIGIMTEVLNFYKAPFTFKQEKTRYGSRAGSNWNLGIMLNKDNEISIGWKNKKNFRAMLNNYANDKKQGVKWELHDIQIVLGKLNYYKMVEPDYVKEAIKSVNGKFSIDIEQIMKQDISA